MDFIRALQALLAPLIEHTSFALAEIRPVDPDTDSRFGFLEYDGKLVDGRVVLFGFYQLSVQRTITARMWIPEDVRRKPLQVWTEPAVMRRRVWLYGPRTDGDDLVRAMITEVTTWLQPVDPTIETDSEAPSSGN